MKNVIDLTQRLAKSKAEETLAGEVHVPAPVIDMTERRQEILLQERRRIQRTILSEFVGAMVVVPSKGLLKVSLYDISELGLAFDVDAKAGHFFVGEEVALRVYLNQQTYFSFVTRIENVRNINDEGVIRHGVAFVKDTINDKALFHFIKFIESVSASLKSDDGDLMVSTIAR